MTFMIKKAADIIKYEKEGGEEGGDGKAVAVDVGRVSGSAGARGMTVLFLLPFCSFPSSPCIPGHAPYMQWHCERHVLFNYGKTKCRV
jgi:hypothetical protein